MGDTVTRLEHRVREAVERLTALDGERGRLSGELESVRVEADRLRRDDDRRRKALSRAADALDGVARDLSARPGGGEGA
jgi:septal ring factor EnvC (AmiA/AmiB activator)